MSPSPSLQPPANSDTSLSAPSVPHLKLATIKPPSDRTPQLIYESYPLPLLLAISPHINAILSSRSSNRPTPTGLILHTPSPTALSLLLSFALLSFALLSSQHGSTSAPAAHDLLSIPLNQCAFYKYGRLVEEARYLGWEYLEEMLVKRMKRIASGQVHSRDVERMLECGRANMPALAVSETDDGKSKGCVHSRPNSKKENGTDISWMLTLSVQSIATALVQDRLQHRQKYEELCESYPEFGRELEGAVAKLRQGEVVH